MKRNLLYMRLLLMVVIATVIAACASMGRPEGGPIDETPPRFVRSNPMPGSTNVNVDKITIYFDENVQVKDAMSKVVMSPPMKNVPKVMGVGNQIRVEIPDTLAPNTTYTVDFADAISDLNEGNELDGFAFAFSTGETIDSMSISGWVFEARTLEPAQGMLVGVHSNLSDTALTTLPFERITRTNQLGQFTVRNLKPGTYNVFAINDVNRDNKWDRSEDIAFYPMAVTTTSERVQVADTLKAADGSDSIVMHMATAFGPDDLLLTWFNEKYTPQYLAKYGRQERNRIHLEMGAAADSFPSITIVGGQFDGRSLYDLSVMESSPTRDTLTYWLRDQQLIDTDSLRMAVRYQRTDSLENLTWTTDTLQFNFKTKKKKSDKKSKETPDSAATPVVELLKLTATSGTLDVDAPLTVSAPTPIASLDSSAIRLEMMVDTLWQPAEMARLTLIDTLKPLAYKSVNIWEPGGKYRLTIDSLAIADIYGISNGPMQVEFSVRPLSDYGNITFLLPGLTGKAVVELLNNSDKPVATVPVVDGRARFSNILPSTFYARLYIDENDNQRYDNGSVKDSIQPEEVYYFPKKIVLKKNWDVEQTWNIYETPVDLQKPLEIKKNKPKSKKNDRDNPDEEEDDQYYDEFGNPSVDPDDPFGKRKNRRYNTLHGRDNNSHTQGAGYQGAGYR